MVLEPPGRRPSAAPTGQLPSTSVDQTRANYRTARLVAVVAGLLGAALAILTPLLPVKQTTAELNWPQNGVLDSVTAPLISYVATDLEHQHPVPRRRRTATHRPRRSCCPRFPSRRPRPSTAAC